MADFAEAYSRPMLMPPPPSQFEPKCEPRDNCFRASHVSPFPSQDFLVNTYLLRPDRRFEVAGAVDASSIRAKDIHTCKR